MPREEIYLEMTLEQLDAWTNAHCADSDDECHRDWDWRPISDEEMLERVRQLEQQTGEKLISRRGERHDPGA